MEKSYEIIRTPGAGALVCGNGRIRGRRWDGPRACAGGTCPERNRKKGSWRWMCGRTAFRAAENIALAGLSEKIATRLSDGVAKLLPGEADSVVIAGMGGELIIKILENGRHMWDSVYQWSVVAAVGDL